MTPIKSSINKEGCSPVSSNCVVWQGPDLCCINLCTGDTVSDVVYKLAVELCNLQQELDLSDTDLKCIFEACQACPQPEKTLKVILQLLIDKVCSLEDLINSLDVSTAGDELVIRMANCFHYQVDGDWIRDLQHSEYTKRIGQRVCDLGDQIALFLSNINDLQDQIDTLDNRVDALESQGDLQVIPSCVYPNSTPRNIDEAWETLETAFCTLKGATGNPSEILDVVDGECSPLPGDSNVKSLSDSSAVLWTGSSQTLAETLVKMWAAICDLRGAVKTIQDTCCTFSCEDIIIDFDAKVTDSATVTLFFGAKSVLPAGFTDCNAALGNKLTITDGSGAVFSTYIKLREDVFNDPTALSEGYAIDLSSSAVDPSKGLTFQMDACLTNGGTTCVKCVTVQASATNTCAFCEITAEGATGDSLVVIYEIYTNS